MSKIAIKQFVTATLNAIYNKIARFYDVSVPATLTVSQSGKVSEWKDRSFDQQHATQNLSVYQPDYDSTAKTVVMGSGKHLTFPVPVNFNGYIYTATKTEGILKLRLNLINLSSSDKTWVEANGLSYGGYEGSPVVGIVFYNQSTISAVDEALINNYLKLICGASGAWPANNTNVNSRFRGDQSSSYLFQFLSEIPIQDNTTLRLNAVTNAHALFYYMRYVTQIPNDLDTSNITDLSYCFANTAISQFPQLNTAKVVNFYSSWRNCYILTTFPLINTAAGTNFNYTWYDNLALYGSGAGIPWGAKLSFPEATQMYFTWSNCRFSQFPDYSTGSDYINNFGKVTVFWDTWSNNPNLTSFTKINTSSAQTMWATWYNCIKLNNIDPIDTRNTTNFNLTWNNCALTQESVDNAIISIAAGLANNRTKIISTVNDVLTGGSNSIPGEVNRRSLTPEAGQRVWESWEEQNPSGSNQSIRYINETIGNIVFNFQQNITGFNVKNWLKAKFGLDIPTKDPQLPTTPGLIHAVFDCDDLSRLTISGSTRKLFLSQDSVSQGATTIRLYTDSTTSYTVPIGFNPSFSGFKIQFTADTTINAATIFTVQSITTSGSTVTSIQLLRTTGSGTSIPSNSTLFFGTQTQFIQIGSSSISVGASAFTITLGSTNTISSGWTPAAGQIAYLPQSVNIQSVMQSNTGLALRENAVQINNTISQWIATTGGNNVTVAQNTLANQPTLTTDATGKYAIFFNGRTFTFTFLNTFNNGRVYIGTTRNAVLDFDLINLASNSTFVFGNGENVPINGLVFVNGIPSTDDDSKIKTWLRNRGSNPLTPMDDTTELASRSNWDYRFGGSLHGQRLSNDMYNLIKSFPAVNSKSASRLQGTWGGIANASGRLLQFPLINTSLATFFYDTWSWQTALTSFPLIPINTTNAVNFISPWSSCSGLTSFPAINTVMVQYMGGAWHNCLSITSFPAINTAACRNFTQAWRGCSSLSQFSLDNILISIAAGLSNNPNKTVFPIFNDIDASISFGTFSSVIASPTNINRRVSNNAESGVNQLWESWETNNATYTNALAIKNLNATYGTGANAVTYNFSNGITGQQARLWMIAFSAANNRNPAWNFSTAAPAVPSVPTNSRAYGTAFGITGNPVTAWTPVSGTSNQSLVNSPSTESLHGLTNIVFGNGKGITFNGLLAGGSYTVYIGLARGYYKFTATLAAGVTTATWGTQLADGTGVLSIVLFNGTPTTNQEAAVINWVNFYGSFNNLDLSDPFTDTNAKQIVFT